MYTWQFYFSYTTLGRCPSSPSSSFPSPQAILVTLLRCPNPTQQSSTLHYTTPLPFLSNTSCLNLTPIIIHSKNITASGICIPNVVANSVADTVAVLLLEEDDEEDNISAIRALIGLSKCYFNRIQSNLFLYYLLFHLFILLHYYFVTTTGTITVSIGLSEVVLMIDELHLNWINV